MAGSLDSATLKLHQAHHHYVVMAEKEVRRRRGALDRYSLDVERHRDGLEYRFNIGEIPPIDEDWWSVTVGDCLFNLRAALDHLVYALHVRHFKGKVPSTIEGSTAFPICNQVRRHRRGRKKGMPIPTSQWKEIKSLSARQRAAIQWLQPYHARNDNLRWLRQSLGDLNEVHNVDKHRHLQVVRRAVLAVTEPRFAPEYGFRSFPSFGALKSNTEVNRWVFNAEPPDIAYQVDVNRYAFIEIALDETGEYSSLFPFLKGLITTTGRIVERFAKWFPPSTSPGVWWVPIPEDITEVAARLRDAGELRTTGHRERP